MFSPVNMTLARRTQPRLLHHHCRCHTQHAWGGAYQARRVHLRNVLLARTNPTQLRTHHTLWRASQVFKRHYSVVTPILETYTDTRVGVLIPCMGSGKRPGGRRVVRTVG